MRATRVAAEACKAIFAVCVMATMPSCGQRATSSGAICTHICVYSHCSAWRFGVDIFAWDGVNSVTKLSGHPGDAHEQEQTLRPQARSLAEDQDILEFHGCKCNTRRIVGLWMAGSIDL